MCYLGMAPNSVFSWFEIKIAASSTLIFISLQFRNCQVLRTKKPPMRGIASVAESICQLRCLTLHGWSLAFLGCPWCQLKGGYLVPEKPGKGYVPHIGDYPPKKNLLETLWLDFGMIPPTNHLTISRTMVSYGFYPLPWAAQLVQKF